MRLAAIVTLSLSLAPLVMAPVVMAQAKPQTSSPANATVPPEINPAWGYEGSMAPTFWSRISPAYSACSRGQKQSPVDIHDARLNTVLKPIEFDDLAGPVTMTNTGRTVRVDVDPGSYIVASGQRYELAYYEFHHPSEHTIHNRLSDMELDMVYRGAGGKTAILAVLLSEAEDIPNATLATLWANLPARAGQSEKVSAMVNPGGLLPADRGYWTYTGSLLEPPCTEGVTWYVFEHPIDISRGQYDAFSALFPMNSRPTQDLHGRKIQADE